MPTFAPTYAVEQQLAAGMLTGSRDTFDQLYRSYAPALLGYISKITGDQLASEEALQKSFIAIWNGRSSYNAETERLFTWMLKITKSVTLGFVPTNRYLVNKKTMSIFNHDIVEERLVKDTSHKTGTHVLQNHLMDLMHFNNYTVEEASAILRLEENTIRTTLRNAISRLKHMPR